MLFNQHSGLQGKHAFLSPSNYHWLNYDDQKLEARFTASEAARRGTDLHAFAHEAIRLRVRLADPSKAITAYVDDGISYGMSCEQPLYYSDNCFGHADTLGFRASLLRIHDLKTGLGKTSERQLEIYAGLFCLEYGVDPFGIGIELRIYQGDEVRQFEPPPEWILEIMDKIVAYDQYVENMKEDRL